VILVDKPGAAQSVISLGLPGAERNSPDYFNLVVMNAIFGGQFSSRLNMNLREDKGYTYGARSGFSWRVRQPGPFTASASVQTSVTAAALTEFMSEFAGMVGQESVTPDELEFCKSYLVRGYPADFETPRDVARQLETVVEYDLPDDYFNRVIPSVQAVTAEDVHRVAEEYLRLDRLNVIVVGDREQIESSLRDLPVGEDLSVMRFDEQFQLVPAE
jgi:predicted Zn-dependent peptidase